MPPSKQLLLFALLCASSLYSARAQGDNDETTESPLHIQGESHVVRSGHKHKIACTFSGDEVGDVADLKWANSNGKVIDGESSASVFTISLHEHGTGHKKRTLHFSAIDPRDQGDYTCSARTLDGSLYEKTVTLVVLDAIDWADASESVGALVGEPLIIDCSANGRPTPEISITDENGEPLDEELFTIAGSEVTIESISKDYDGKIVSCTANQMIPAQETYAIERKDVKINVWHIPEFAASHVDRYAIIDRHATLVCQVTSSNPPPAHFAFFRGGSELTDPQKYHLRVDIDHMTAHLKIHDVDEDDFGEYRCEVNNRKAHASQQIDLKEASQPGEVKASLEAAKRQALIWMIDESADEGGLPVETIQIQYIRKSLLDRVESDSASTEYDNDNAEKQVWKTQSVVEKRPLSSSQLYEVSGLREDTDYVFRFSAVSEAGEGDQVEITARTEGDHKLRDSVSSSTLAGCSLLLLLVLL